MTFRNLPTALELDVYTAIDPCRTQTHGRVLSCNVALIFTISRASRCFRTLLCCWNQWREIHTSLFLILMYYSMEVFSSLLEL